MIGDALDHVMVPSIGAGTVFVLIVVWAAWCYAFGGRTPRGTDSALAKPPWMDCTVAGWMIAIMLLAMFVIWATAQPAL